jgi:Methyltransferase domain
MSSTSLLMETPNLDALAVVGAPFGDSDYIKDQLHQVYDRRLARIAEGLPVAEELAKALAAAGAGQRNRFLGHPSIKSAIQNALRAVVWHTPTVIPLAECERVFERMLRQLRLDYDAPRSNYSLLSGLDCLGSNAYHPFVWSEDNSDDPFRSVFRRLISEHFGDPVASCNSASIKALQEGIALLEEVAPCMTRSALSHVQIVALFPAAGSWGKQASSSQFSIGGAVFLRQESLDDPWWVAEHLLHEALHQKLYDIRVAHSLIARESVLEFMDSDEHAPESFDIPEPIWNRRDPGRLSKWPLSRVMAALHVYVHLAIYGDSADRRLNELERRFGNRDRESAKLVSSRTAFRRAWFLLDTMRESLWKELGPAGECLVDWLNQCLDLLGPDPHRPKMRLRLSIERYEREARATQGILGSLPDDGRAGSDKQSAVASQLVELLSSELAETGRILGNIGEVEESARLTSASLQFRAPLKTDSVLAARTSIVNALSKALSFARPDLIMVEDGDANLAAVEAAQAMIDASTEKLEPIMARWQFRSAVDAWRSVTGQDAGLNSDRRSWLFALTDVLGRPYGTEEFCLFLHSLVRMNRPLSMVELGSGFGASAFWMALAAKQNGNGHVWSYDNNGNTALLPQLLSKAKQQLAHTPWADLENFAPELIPGTILKRLGLTSFLTFTTQQISLDSPKAIDSYGFEGPVDLLFSDFQHGPAAILGILGGFLPRMSPAGSIFIDSASTSLPSYLLLENLVSQLQRGTIPLLLQEHAVVDLQELMCNRRITLVHITKCGPGRSQQNSVAWLKFEPTDLIPHPRTVMRDL